VRGVQGNLEVDVVMKVVNHDVDPSGGDTEGVADVNFETNREIQFRHAVNAEHLETERVWLEVIQ
jgi:hypothetical protein